MRWPSLSLLSSLVLTTTGLGCLEPELIPCGESLCPQGTLCRPDGTCVAEDLVTRCEGVEPGAACGVLGALPGRCVDGVCTEITCGDGYVDAELHEVCDGSTDAQCVSLGFDMGRPQCAACALDTSTCTRFGWVRVEYASSKLMWTDGTILAYTTYSPEGLVIRGGGHDITSERVYYALAGGGGQVFALSDAAFVEHAAGTTLERIPGPTSAAVDLAVAEDGVPVVLGADCRVFAYEGQRWSEIGGAAPVTGGDCTSIAVEGAGASLRVVVSGSDTRFHVTTDRDHFAARSFGTSNVSTIVVHGGELWFVDPRGVFRASLSGSAPPALALDQPFVSSIAFIGDHFYATAGGLVMRVEDGRVATFRGPTGGLVADDGHDGLYMYQGPIYRFTGTSFGELGALASLSEQELVSASCRLGSRVVAMTQLQLFGQTSGGTWEKYDNAFAPTSHRGIACSGDTDVAVVTHVEDDHSFLGLSPSGPQSLTVGDSGDELKDAVWIAPDKTIIVVGTEGHAATANTSRGWVAEMAATWRGSIFAVPLIGAPVSFGTCRFFAVHGTDLAHVVAAGRCDGKGTIIERVAMNDWRLIYQSPTEDGGFRAVLRTPARIFAAGDSGAVWFDGTSWHADPTVIGRTLSGTDDDLWLSGAFTNVQHFDGTRWSQVATAALSQIAVSATDGDIVFPGAAPGHVNLIRDRQVVPP